MKEVVVNISPQGFPSQFVSDAEKASDEFGLQVGQAIQMSGLRETDLHVDSMINGESSTTLDCMPGESSQ